MGNRSPWEGIPSQFESAQNLRMVLRSRQRRVDASDAVSDIIKDAGRTDAFVMALVGNESAAMSHRYTHVGKEALARAAKTLPEV